MANVTDYPYGPEHATLPPVAWKTGLSPNRRWVPARLPADGAPLPSWTSQFGDLSLPVADPAKVPVVGTEAGVRHMLTSGVANEGLSVNITDPATMRTVVVIARPNVGDSIPVPPGRIFRFGDTGAVEQSDADSAVANGGVGFSGVNSRIATRGKWHLYSISLPPLGTTGANGIFVVDELSTTFPYDDAHWNAVALRIAATGGTGRQLRVAEIITSAGTFTAANLIALYAKAKAWYPGLAW